MIFHDLGENLAPNSGFFVEGLKMCTTRRLRRFSGLFNIMKTKNLSNATKLTSSNISSSDLFISNRGAKWRTFRVNFCLSLSRCFYCIFYNKFSVMDFCPNYFFRKINYCPSFCYLFSQSCKNGQFIIKFDEFWCDKQV